MKIVGVNTDIVGTELRGSPESIRINGMESNCSHLSTGEWVVDPTFSLVPEESWCWSSLFLDGKEECLLTLKQPQSVSWIPFPGLEEGEQPFFLLGEESKSRPTAANGSLDALWEAWQFMDILSAEASLVACSRRYGFKSKSGHVCFFLANGAPFFNVPSPNAQ